MKIMDTPSLSSSPSSSSPHSLISSPSNSQSPNIHPGGGNMAPNPDQYTPPIQAVDLPIVPLPPEVLAYIASKINDTASLLSLRETCTVFKTAVTDVFRTEYTGFINSDEPKLPDNFYTKLKISENLRIDSNLGGIEIPTPDTAEWEELKAPIPIKQPQGEARQIALIKNLYIKAWNLLQRQKTRDNPQQASKLMRLLLDLLPHISNAEGYAAALFPSDFPTEIFTQLAKIHLDLCLQLVTRHFLLNRGSLAYKFIMAQCPNGSIALGDLERLKSKRGQSFLFLAVQEFCACSSEQYEARVELLSMLLTQEADLEKTNEQGETLLLYILNYWITLKEKKSSWFDLEPGKQPDRIYELVAFLLAKGADCNAIDKKGNTPLMIACTYWIEEVLPLLIERPEININVLDMRGLNVLHKATLYGELSLVHCLIQHPQIDVNIKDSNGNTALHYAVEKLPNRENNSEFVEILLTHPEIDVNVVNHEGVTPLLKVIRYGNLGILEILLQTPQIDVNARNHKGKSALHIAVECRYEQLIDCLIQHPQINANIQDNEGQTALHHAVCYSDVSILQAFLRHPQIDLNAINNKGKSILHEAAFSFGGAFPVVKELLKSGKIERTILLMVFNEAVIKQSEGLANAFLVNLNKRKKMDFINDAYAFAIQAGQQNVAKILREKYGLTERPANKRGRDEYEPKTSS
jgi:ankyrin repeat protein